MLTKDGLRTFIGPDRVSCDRAYYQSEHQVIFHAGCPDTMLLRFVGEVDQADSSEWPKVTLGEIRQWLKDRAETARLDEDARLKVLAERTAYEAAEAAMDKLNSPGANAAAQGTEEPAAVAAAPVSLPDPDPLYGVPTTIPGATGNRSVGSGFDN